MPDGNSSPDRGSGVSAALGVADSVWANARAAGKPFRAVNQEPSAARTIVRRETGATLLGSSVLCSPRTNGMSTNASVAQTEPGAPFSAGQHSWPSWSADNPLSQAYQRRCAGSRIQHFTGVVTGAGVHARSCSDERRLQIYAATPRS